VDGKQVKLAESLAGIIILNLNSYAGGCDLWGSSKNTQFGNASISDGMLEIVGIKGAFDMVTFFFLHLL
jgi:diacylglycerol kinase (ATP)